MKYPVQMNKSKYYIWKHCQGQNKARLLTLYLELAIQLVILPPGGNTIIDLATWWHHLHYMQS